MMKKKYYYNRSVIVTIEEPMNLGVTIVGGGTYLAGDIVEISAQSSIIDSNNLTWTFSEWSDGNLNRTRSFTAETDVTLTAIYMREPIDLIHITVDSTFTGDVKFLRKKVHEDAYVISHTSVSNNFADYCTIYNYQLTISFWFDTTLLNVNFTIVDRFNNPITVTLNDGKYSFDWVYDYGNYIKLSVSA